MKFTRLRIHGFKSFVEATELLIEPGMTGVVGPNGCGKSNLVEAIRWVMGESSYKSMRASGMDDVIFSGSGNRPARNTAEVTIQIDNEHRLAPAQFNGADMLEVTRRIERDAGSAYRINGKDVRARDVQLLFADASTGSRSPALVRQGQIGEMINAKPSSRRLLLEEAAGISGLYSRRHEAELRLKGAESNLERLNDVLGQIEQQLQSLKRQARQATRYKNVSAEIVKAQALLLHVKWTAARDAATQAEAALADQIRLVSERTQTASQAATQRAVSAHALPPLREKEAQAAAAAQRLAHARGALDQELERASGRMREIEAQIRQLDEDMAREKAMIGDAAETRARLDEEEAELASEGAEAGDGDAAAIEAHQRAVTAMQEGEQRLNALLNEVAQAKARRAQLTQAIGEAASRQERAASQLAQAESELAALKAAQGENSDVARMHAAVEQAGEAVARAEQEQLAAEQALKQARDDETRLREPLRDAESEAQRLQTEAATLSKILNVEGSDLWPPLVDAVRVDKGYEAALGAALGDDLEAPADAAAPAHWALVEALADDGALPEGARPLSQLVRGPDVLTRRLAQTGLVERARGAELQRRLKPGQRLVSAEGDLWRWDGFTAAAEAPTAAAQRLAQRNRLAELDSACKLAQQRASAARAEVEAAGAAVALAASREEKCRGGWREAQSLASQTRDRLAAAERAMARETERIGALSEAQARLSQAVEEAREAKTQAESSLAALEPSGDQDQALESLRAQVAQLRAVAAEAQARADGLKREKELRARRLETVRREREASARRCENAEKQIAILEERGKTARAELEKLDGVPAEIEASRRRLMSEISDAEGLRAEAADAVAEAEAALAEADKAGRAADQALGEAREEKARIESRLEAARQRHGEIGQEIADQAGIAPQGLLARAGLGAGDPLPRVEETEARLDQLTRERERLGAVNLRAEEEAGEIEAELTRLTAEREDLEKAIRRLRQGIGQLNKEGRERLLAAFETVNSHFQQLFATLFNGGAAELRLTESDDPLEAGLEIMARPPGKKLQVLSLLSGGEQALTAMALIFAMFLTNPAPICVLDEVDAPLDDANVERFCALVREITRSTDTRFLIITHHPLTMSRMDRLFGVTMAERGVSQLVSVDLETAERYREAG
ncbi:MAG: chromosome segregation protein SMC [Rhodobiaceae bacterium]|nr:chromosome segregation protein SMC [Rhodobiaceae bacterium]